MVHCSQVLLWTGLFGWYYHSFLDTMHSTIQESATIYPTNAPVARWIQSSPHGSHRVLSTFLKEKSMICFEVTWVILWSVEILGELMWQENNGNKYDNFWWEMLNQSLQHKVQVASYSFYMYCWFWRKNKQTWKKV